MDSLSGSHHILIVSVGGRLERDDDEQQMPNYYCTQKRLHLTKYVNNRTMTQASNFLNIGYYFQISGHFGGSALTYTMATFVYTAVYCIPINK